MNKNFSENIVNVNKQNKSYTINFCRKIGIP